MYSEVTRSIKVSVKPFYLEDESSPAEDRYVWAYHVRIENGGLETVQLRNRHWQITDSRGQMQEVRGAGVVGEQPVLAPGESYEYTSGLPLPTPSGLMVGTIRVVATLLTVSAIPTARTGRQTGRIAGSTCVTSRMPSQSRPSTTSVTRSGR